VVEEDKRKGKVAPSPQPSPLGGEEEKVRGSSPLWGEDRGEGRLSGAELVCAFLLLALVECLEEI